MIIILFDLLISAVFVSASVDSCQESRHLESVCGNYCFKSIKPMLDYTKKLQSKVDDFEKRPECPARSESKEKLIKPGTPYQLIGSKYYYIEPSKEVNWFGAVHECLAIGGHLVSIKNLDEFNAIIEKVQRGKDYWIDINDLANEGEYLSVATGQKVTYFQWRSIYGSKEPNNYYGNEHCGELLFSYNMYSMNDELCNTKELFICEPRNQ